MMHPLPPVMITLVAPFAPRFSERGWRHALVLVAGTSRAPGRRTGGAALRALGLRGGQHCARSHRVLNRA